MSESGAPSRRTDDGVARPVEAPESTWESDRVEAGVLNRFAEDAEIRVEFPPRTYRGIEQIRRLVRQVLPLAAVDGIVVRENQARKISSVTVPLNEATVEDLRAAFPSLWFDGAIPGGPSVAPPVEGKRPRIRGFFAILGATLIAAIGAVATLVGILFDFFPGLKGEPPPTVLGASLSNVALEERTIDPDSGVARLVISYVVEYTGYKGDTSIIEWAAFDAATQRRVVLEPSGGAPAHVNRRPEFWVEPEAPDERVNTGFEVPVPREARCVVIRVYVYDEDHSRLDYGDSAPFHTHDPANPGCPPPTETPEPAT